MIGFCCFEELKLLNLGTIPLCLKIRLLPSHGASLLEALGFECLVSRDGFVDIPIVLARLHENLFPSLFNVFIIHSARPSCTTFPLNILRVDGHVMLLARDAELEPPAFRRLEHMAVRKDPSSARA